MFCRQVPGAVCLTCEEWGPESGLVTAAMKLKRRPLQVSIVVFNICLCTIVYICEMQMSRRGIKTTSTACTETDRGPEQVQRLMRAIGKFEKKWDLVSQLFFPVDLRFAKVIGADQSVK